MKRNKKELDKFIETLEEQRFETEKNKLNFLLLINTGIIVIVSQSQELLVKTELQVFIFPLISVNLLLILLLNLIRIRQKNDAIRLLQNEKEGKEVVWCKHSDLNKSVLFVENFLLFTTLTVISLITVSYLLRI